MAAGLGTTSLRVVANTAVFEATLRRSIKRMAKQSAAIFAVGATVAAGNFFGGAIKDSLKLEDQLAKIQTFLKGQPQAWKEAFNADAIRGLSNELGISVTEVADSVYYMIGSGVKLEDVMDSVRAASASAVATGSDLGTVANFISSASNAFGGKKDSLTGRIMDAAHASDIFFLGLQEGKATGNDFAKFLSTAIPSAEGLGIGLGEVVSAASAATLTGKQARKVMTGLDYVMSGLGNSSKGVGEVFKNISGKDFPTFVKEGGTLQQAIKMLGTEVGIQGLNQVKGASTGIRAIQELLVVWDQYVDVQEKVKGAEGAATSARDTVNATLKRQLDFFRNSFKNFRGSVGDFLLPILTDALHGLIEWGGNVRDTLSTVWDNFKIGYAVVKPAIDLVFNTFRDAFNSVDWEGYRSIIVDWYTGIALGLSPLIDAFVVVGLVIGEMARLLAPLVDLLKNMSPVIVAVAAGIAGYYSVLLLINTALKAWLILSKLQVVWSALTAAAFVIQTLATEGLAAAWVALDIAMDANPIGAVVAVIAALVVGLIYAWKTSETFRHVVLTAFAAVVQGVGTAIKFIVSMASMWVKAYLYAFKAILDGLSHLPSWAGGGHFEDGSAAVQHIIDGVDAIKSSIDGLIDKAIDGAKALAALVSVQDEGFGTQGLDEVYAQLAKDYPNGVAAGPAKAPKAPKAPNTEFPGGGYSPADDAKKAAAEAAKAIKAAMGRIKTDLNRIAKNTSKQTADTIKNNFSQLYADMKDGKVSKAVIDAAKKVEKQLLKLAKARDKNMASLVKQQDKLEDLTKKSKELTNDMMHSFSELGDITNTDRMRTVFRQGIFPSASNQIQNLKRALYISDRFAEAIKKLQKLGLKKTSLDELIAAGPEGGLGAAEGLAAGGKAAVTQVNNLQDTLNRNGKALGSSLADQFYGHGIEIAEGLIKGLESEQAKLLKTMDKLGDQMAVSFKKRLGIHSPSKVFEGFGQDITAGLGQGITGSLSTVTRANGAMAAGASVTFGPGAVVVNGVKNGDEEKGGLLTGRGIVGVLESRRTSAALSGIGS